VTGSSEAFRRVGLRRRTYFHGGSYVYGSARTTHADVIARLALASGVTCVGIDYRLAPEHVYPAQIEDAVRAFEALRADPGGRRVIVAGDSAGGNLAIELQLALRDRGKEQAAGAVLISPWSDLTMPGSSFRENDRFDYGTREVLARRSVGDVREGRRGIEPRVNASRPVRRPPRSARLAGPWEGATNCPGLERQ